MEVEGRADRPNCVRLDKVEEGSIVLGGQTHRTVNGFIVECLLGRGTYAEVFRARQGAVSVALKIHNKKKLAAAVAYGSGGSSKKRTALDDLFNEIAIHSTLCHPNIITLHQVWEDPQCDSVYMVFDLADHTSQNFAKNKTTASALDHTTIVSYTRDLAAGLEYLHSQLIVHHDIKPSNLLVKAGTLKIADFGVSEKLDTAHTRCNRQTGSMAFWAPEVCDDGDHDSYEGRPVDMWATGITLYCFAAGRLPYQASDPMALFDEILDDRPIEPPPGVDQHIATALTGLMQRNPAKRLTSPELLAMSKEWPL